MATVISCTAYMNGEQNSTVYIGALNGTYYQRCYGIKTGSSGATGLTLVLHYDSWGYGDDFYAVLSEKEGPYTSTLSSDGTRATLDRNAKTLTWTFTGKWIPGQTVYVQLHASRGTGNYFWVTVGEAVSEKYVEVSESGSYGGIVRIYTGGAWHTALPYLYTGGAWHQASAYVYTASGGWSPGC